MDVRVGLLRKLSAEELVLFNCGVEKTLESPLDCLENPMDGGAWWATVHGVTKSWTRLSDFTFTFRQHIKKQRHYFANKVLSSQSYGFSSSHVST